ncbi:MAG: hypothetical protein U0871_06485 [Gemmataceae bacterium]
MPYTWVYATSVTAISEPVTITEFGAFEWVDGRWTFANFTSTPFSGRDFADWYSCPGGVATPDRAYTDPTNWSGRQELQSGKAMWYYLGVTASGQRVKGVAVIEEAGVLTD